jgi:hypothetical protein
MLLVDGQQPAGDLPAQGAGEPFADRVRLRGLRRAGRDRDALRCGRGIEGTGELARAVAELPASVLADITGLHISTAAR